MSDEQRTPPEAPVPGDTPLKQLGAIPLGSADPAVIGPYTPLGRLGSGGMGRVYLARPVDGGSGLAAVKVIRPEYAEDPDFRRRFEREATMHTRVGTPYAPELLDAGFQEELLWMATEYLPGLSLTDAVRECGVLEPAGLWRLVAELGRALSVLDATGIVHRDLKPSNVVLSGQGAHVIDFGISQALDSSSITTTGNRVGTPAFMAPEYLREGRCDSASDVFSLAGTLIYAATGTAPFGNGTGVDVMHRVAFEEPRPELMEKLAAADAPVAELLSACLAKNPAGRPTPHQLVEAAAAHLRTPSWQEPLESRLLARRQACEVLRDASTGQSAHLRTPARRVDPPAAGPALGPPAPGTHDAPMPPGRYAPPAVAVPHDPPALADGRPPAAGPGIPAAGRDRKKAYFAVVAGLAVCAVAVSAFLLTRPPSDRTASSPPTATGTTAADEGERVPLPGSADGTSASPRGGKNGTEKKEGEQGTEAKGSGGSVSGAAGGTGDAGETGTDAATTESGGSGGTTASPSPADTTAGPATPAWISECTYYSGSELTRRGDENERVTQVQCMLTRRGYSTGAAGVDGRYGKDTASAVKAFQRDKGLAPDGKVGPDTWTALRSST
ncbi:protein kinase [Streptomyces sp. BV286]|uniref:protein kinase domain-containing protein n=1 Tax=Streptomyces sp. BV286 TaxID=2849672 RepID=UPI0027E3F91F|nr:protein kinase [Streptomyces sp. BV286]